MSGLAGATVAFRVDASLLIGTGHVMRCLTLATALRAEGAACRFVSRDQEGQLAALLEHQGFSVSLLPRATPADDLAIAGWQRDAEQTRMALGTLPQTWLVVDHYGLDARWEGAVRDAATRLLVIDDLADRPHCCDLLLDQNLGRRAAEYASRVPSTCRVLAGARYAMLRAEFARCRAASLQRREAPLLRRLLIAMGGIDLPNVTGAVLQALCLCALPEGLEISVVLGSGSPWVAQVSQLAAQVHARVRVGIDDMAREMSEADLAIGAAGSSAWERCCLGLPTLMFVLADNQRAAATKLEAAGAAIRLGADDDLADHLRQLLGGMVDGTKLAAMSRAAGAITDGNGVVGVLAGMRQIDAMHAEVQR